MKKMTILAAVLVLAVALTACGGEKTPAETTATAAAAVTTVPTEATAAAQPLELTDWVMNANTWSSPNGATIHISATPNYHEEGQKADFVVRLNSEEIFRAPCQWDGTSYTASADLNAADGYCYYVVLTTVDGAVSEVAVNTPEEPTDEAFVNMASALESYCTVIIEESSFDSGKLTLTSGNVQVKTPTITNEGEAITCQEAVLVLTFDGEATDQEALTLTPTDTAGLFEATLNNLVLDVPKLENNQKVELVLNVTLTNGQSLSAFGGNWSYDNEGLLPAFG